MDNINPEISIIVPVYNTGKYLERCLNSILKQTFVNFELILVDDGSTDDSGKICDRFAEKDKRIKVIHKQNGGQSAARNVGLDIAKGNFIGFVDSDDWISVDMYEYLYNLLQNNNCDIANARYILVNDENNIDKGKEEKIRFFEEKGILREFLYEGTISGSYSPCRNLYKRSLFDGIKFPVGKINEDIITLYQVLYNARKMVKSDKITYFYYQSANSTTRGGLKLKDFDLLDISNKLMLFSSTETYWDIAYLGRIKMQRAYFSLLAKIAFYGIEDEQIDYKKTVKELTKQVRENLFSLLGSPIPFSRKCMMVVLCCHIRLLGIPLKIYQKIKL